MSSSCITDLLMPMEMESTKMLDNGRSVFFGEKRKREAHGVAYSAGACRNARYYVQDALPETFDKKLDSHMGFDGGRNSVGPKVNNLLLKNYSNFMKSGLPQRVLVYENGEWTDFPEGIIDTLKEDFGKKAVIEVDFRGGPSLLDFLHMNLLDLETGFQKPIAWINGNGNCYFPQTYSVSNDHPVMNPEPNDTREIKLQLEIEVTADGNFNVGECSKGSNSCVKRLRVEGQAKPTNIGEMDQEASTDEKPALEIKKVISENRSLGSVHPGNYISGSLKWKGTYDAVKHVFIKSMGHSISEDNIHGVQRCSGFWAQSRLELFEKQFEITTKYRGHANAKYAWLGSTKEAASRIMMHGLGLNELPKTKLTYGTGIHLTSLGRSRISAKYCDVDENGVQHMVLCRVILGNVELVHPGSEQSRPSSENFDSGVNDFLYPAYYTIWDMNMSTHIYPEYIVSFKMPPNAKGIATERGSKEGVFPVTQPTAYHEKLQSSPSDLVGDSSQNPDAVDISHGKGPTIKFAGKPPKSIWMHFPALLKALEDKVPYSSMKLVYQFYDQFRLNRISRGAFVRIVRETIGDPLLRTMMTSLQPKVGSLELKVSKQEQNP